MKSQRKRNNLVGVMSGGKEDEVNNDCESVGKLVPVALGLMQKLTATLKNLVKGREGLGGNGKQTVEVTEEDYVEFQSVMSYWDAAKKRLRR